MTDDLRFQHLGGDLIEDMALFKPVTTTFVSRVSFMGLNEIGLPLSNIIV